MRLCPNHQVTGKMLKRKVTIMRSTKSTVNTSLAQDIKAVTTQGTVVSTEEPLHMVTKVTTTRRPGTVIEDPHTPNMEVITSTPKVVASIATINTASTTKKRTGRGSSHLKLQVITARHRSTRHSLTMLV